MIYIMFIQPSKNVYKFDSRVLKEVILVATHFKIVFNYTNNRTDI